MTGYNWLVRNLLNISNIKWRLLYYLLAGASFATNWAAEKSRFRHNLFYFLHYLIENFKYFPGFTRGMDYLQYSVSTQNYSLYGPVRQLRWAGLAYYKVRLKLPPLYSHTLSRRSPLCVTRSELNVMSACPPLKKQSRRASSTVGTHCCRQGYI